MTRLLRGLALLALATTLPACGGGDDDGPAADASVSPDATRDSGGSNPDAARDSGSTLIDATVTAPPVISRVTWTPAAGCVAGTSSNFTIAITVTDADTAAGSLIYSGSAAGCSGSVTTNPGTLNCPNLAPYTGSVTVRDPQGNMDTQGIIISPCTAGAAP